MTLKTLEKRIEKLEKKVEKLEIYKQDRKIIDYDKGRPIFKEDILKCHKCGASNFLFCDCGKNDDV